MIETAPLDCSSTTGWEVELGQRPPQIAGQAIVDSVVNMRRWGHALFTESAPLDAFRQLDLLVQYLVGKRSPPAAVAVAAS